MRTEDLHTRHLFDLLSQVILKGYDYSSDVTADVSQLISRGEIIYTINLKFVDYADVFNRLKRQLIFLLLSYNVRFCYQIKLTIDL